MATWRNGYTEDCKSYPLFTHTLIIPYKLTYLHLIQTARTLLCHSCATLSFETVERSFYLQSPTKVSYETSLVPSEHSFGTSYLRISFQISIRISMNIITTIMGTKKCCIFLFYIFSCI